MSYDLYLKPKAGSFTLEGFLTYFRRLNHFAIEGNQAWYNNENTGVYFLCEYQDPDDELEEYFPLLININFVRPSIFIREIEPIVSKIINENNLIVSDPQIDGVGEGEYSKNDFISGWLHGNKFSVNAVKDNGSRVTLPQKTLEYIWKWNFEKEELQNRLGDEVFVPSIMTFLIDGEFKTAICWGDGIPVAIPNVDEFLIVRKKYAPWKLFGKNDDIVAVSRVSLDDVISKHSKINSDGILLLNYLTPPDEIVNLVKKRPKETRNIQGVSIDAILDSEYFS